MIWLGVILALVAVVGLVIIWRMICAGTVIPQDDLYDDPS